MESADKSAVLVGNVYEAPDSEIVELGVGGFLCQASPINPYNEFNLGNDEF